MSLLLAPLPVSGDKQVMDAWDSTAALEENEMYPEVLNNPPSEAGWSALVAAEQYKLNQRTFNSIVTGAGSATFLGIDSFPVILPAIGIEFATDAFNPLGSLRVEIEETFITDVAPLTTNTKTSYWEGQIVQKSPADQKALIVFHLWGQLRNVNPVGPVITPMQRVIAQSVKLAHSSDAQVGDRTQIVVTIATSIAVLSSSIELITPGSKNWNSYVKNMLTADVKEFLDDYGDDFDASILTGSPVKAR